MQTGKGTMKAWQIHQFGGIEKLMFSNTVGMPQIKVPNDILVQVHAASINPIDCEMRGGYGGTLLGVIKNKSLFNSGREVLLPLILGRDFSGVVVEAGKGVKKYKPGDQVWGTVFASKPGCLAEYTIATENEISHKPTSITHTEAGSIPYVACTSMSALCMVGELSEKNTIGKRVLIHGGAGGIGTFAIQLMKAWGAHVTTTCSTDAIQLVTSLGADVAVDYKTQNVQKELASMEKFDFILDSFGKEKTGYSMDYLKPYKKSMYITLKHPFMKNFDNYGLPGGAMKTVADAAFDTIKGLQKGINLRWAVYVPNGKGLGKIAKMVDKDLIKPVIDKVFQFDEVKAAFEKVEQGHGRGKTVIEIVKQTVDSKGREST